MFFDTKSHPLSNKNNDLSIIEDRTESITKNKNRMALNKIKRKLLIYPLAIMLSVLVYSSCNSSTFSPTPQSFGGINKIIVVADQDLWDGPTGDTLRFYLGAAYPVLPQPEPIFDLQHFTAEEISEDSDRLRFRTMLYIADMSDANSYAANTVRQIVGDENIQKMKESEDKADVKISEGRWAVNQTVLFFYSDGEEATINNIKAKSSSIAELVRKQDDDMIKNRLYASGRNKSMTDKIEADFGITMPIPGDYIAALEEKENNFLWLRKLEKNSHVHTNILIYKLPYKDTEQLKPQGIKTLRDSLGKKYIASGQVDDSYMRVNDINLPLYHENVLLDNKFAVKLKGIWEMSGAADMMGGAFVSYMVHDEANSQVVFLDAFAYAPGKKKRDIMQRLEQILSDTKVGK